MSQKNYIMSKAGDAVEDQMDDGVTPTPRQDKKYNAFGDSDTSDIKEFKDILNGFDNNNRHKLFERLDELFIMGDHSKIMDMFFADILKS
jgi:hypothetical protein